MAEICGSGGVDVSTRFEPVALGCPINLNLCGTLGIWYYHHHQHLSTNVLSRSTWCGNQVSRAVVSELCNCASLFIKRNKQNQKDA